MNPPHARTFWPYAVLAIVIAMIAAVAIGRLAARPEQVDPEQREVASATPAHRPVPVRVPVPMSVEQREARREAAQQQQEQRGRNLHEALAQRFASEQVDAAWAAAKESRLLAASVNDEIRSVNAQPANFRTSCRSSVCRIDADFASRGAAEDWLTLFSTGLGDEVPNEAYVVMTNPDGSIHLEIMGLARK